MCNEARIECREGTFKAAGAPTEAALVVLAEKLGVPNQAASRHPGGRAELRPGQPPGWRAAVVQCQVSAFAYRSTVIYDAAGSDCSSAW